jgi:uncharacterized protein (DUF885 family)
VIRQLRRPAVVLALALGIVVARGAATRTQQRGVDEFFSSFTDAWMRAHPNRAASTRYFTGAEQAAYERQLQPVTLDFAKQEVALARRGLAELRRIDRGAMTPAQRESADIMEWQLDAIVREEPYLATLTFPLNQFNGVNVSLVETLTVSHAINSEADGVNYIARLRQVAARVDEATTRAAEISEQGILPPRFIADATLAQMRSFIAVPAAQNPFVTTLAERVAAVGSIPAARREALVAEATGIVQRDVYPAWRRAQTLLEGQLPRTTSDAGLWRLKNGDKAYAAELHFYTTTDLTADQIHQIGLQQVARIEGEMDRLLRQLGRTQGPVKDRIEQLRTDLAYPDWASDGSRAQIMRDVDGIIADAQRRAALLFDLQPKAAVMARPFPRFRENNAAANYSGPPPDGSRPAVFQIPLRQERMTRFGLRSLVYHETVPGHHFQIALQVENTTLPRFRQIRAFGGLSAFAEGWGLYAERLAAESGWYEGDIEGRLGQLDAELFRARRLVVDTGLHAKHWTRQQAIDYGIEASEVERYVVYPGQACSYMMGELALLEQRDRFVKARGTPDAQRQYHSLVLRLGTVPLQVLERAVGAALN